MKPITHASLFSGIGGFDLAAQECGFDNIFQVEKDKFCLKLLDKNFPKTKKYNNIINFDGTPYKNKIDIISAGFPCQPFSISGKRKGKEDDRYLWNETNRVIGEVKPTFVVCENVPGIISMELDQVLFDLERQKYTTETFVLPAASLDAWHLRERVWIIAYSCGIGSNKGKSKRTPKQPYQNGEERITAHSYSERFEEQRSTFTNAKRHNSVELYWKCDWQTWEIEPTICRNSHGLSHRVDRIKGLGNAIVPQLAIEIFETIKKVI